MAYGEKQEYNKKDIRNEIILAAQNYKENLVGKYFLYIFDNRCIEVCFKPDNFKHLTGVDSNLTAGDFYQKAKSRMLSTSQFYFSKNHPYKATKKKIRYLNRLHEFTTQKLYVLEDMQTNTHIYHFGLTNFDFSLGLIENVEKDTNIKINDCYVPQTFRVRDKSFEKSSNRYTVQFILMKKDEKDYYHTVLLGDKGQIKYLPEAIKVYIDKKT